MVQLGGCHCPQGGNSRSLTLKSSSSSSRVASRRSKWCWERAKAMQASSSTGSSLRCTALQVQGHAGDEGEGLHGAASPQPCTCHPCGRRRRSHPQWRPCCRSWLHKTAPLLLPGRRRWTARKPEHTRRCGDTAEVGGGGHKKHGGHWAIAGQRHCGSEGHLGDNKGALGIQETWLTSEIWGHGGCLGWRGGVGTWGCRGHSGDVVLRDTEW